MRVIHRCGLYTGFQNMFLDFHGVRVIHQCGLYTGNYGTVLNKSHATLALCCRSKVLQNFSWGPYILSSSDAAMKWQLFLFLYFLIKGFRKYIALQRTRFSAVPCHITFTLFAEKISMRRLPYKAEMNIIYSIDILNASNK